jgi:transposase
MIPAPSGARVWLAAGHTDMRKGFDGLALLVQETLKRDPHSTHPVETADGVVRCRIGRRRVEIGRSDYLRHSAAAKYFHEWTSANVREQLLNLLLALRVTMCTEC